ncbi:hypothetical protein A2W45_03525 [Candidatus Curtissbacteria bacterium RIFCSPHIGHO2_12_41_11]|uniref:OmpR/PhoB-type domain-containing protein n=3 Tax=Candidatus Curtissiibacteriota TaxID=1752717 RepID=A0A1F5HUG5_9BACT|nr:MAG: hypothetical protein UU56_C0002G0027 [Candidatus Curtissbacteria bacterium GW2011_GWA2_41_24]OGD99087.1 MAG: hypothetical protein A2W45_03525 [Candidatus Curtissbacteria bacterium RIFCSPHIGHO2_12_41_11]OGE07822.1 MAG: hypothetical protein A2W70_02925 [Candidatus Curtissbacteria bacterium RIFCSPLOWO2_02_41_11]
MAEREKTFATVADKYLHDLAVTRWQWRKAKEEGVEVEITIAKTKVDEIWTKRSESEIAQGLQARRAPVLKEAVAPTVIPSVLPRIEVEIGRDFVFPDGGKVADLSAKEKQILSRLHFSPDEALTSSEIAKTVYDKKVSIAVTKNRLSVILSRIRRKLQDAGWRIVDLTPHGEFRKGNESKYYLAPVEEKPQAVEEVEKPILRFFTGQNQIELAGRRIKLADKQLKVLQVLARSVGQKIPTRRLSQEAFANPTPRETFLSDKVKRLRERINSPEWGDILVSSGNKSGGSWYLLQNVNVVWPEETRSETVKEKPISRVEEVEKRLPTLRIDQETREVTIDGRTVKISGRINWEVFNHLAKNQNKDILWSEIARIARGVGSKAKYPARDVVDSIKRILEFDPKNPQLIISSRPGGKITYRLNAQVEFVGEVEKTKRYKESHQVFEVTLPDGQIIEIRGKLRARALESLAKTSKENPVQTDKISEALYGVYSETNQALIWRMMSNLRKFLKPFNWQIVNTVGGERIQGELGAYYLEKITKQVEAVPTGEEAPVIEEVALVIEEAPLPEAAVPVVEPAEVQPPEVIVKPYEPTEEEKRSKEETRLLAVIVSMLSVNPRLRFEELQRELYSKERDRQVLGDKIYFIYRAEELKDKFVSAFTKMREEAEIAHLKETWTVEERQLWERLQLLQQRWSGYDIEDFKRKVRLEIDRSVRQFYRDHPSGSGREVEWVRRKHEPRR